jgi:hypothetical protein
MPDELSSPRIRIPRTCPRRGEPCWAKLLQSVDPNAHDGFGFHGTFLRCGREIGECDLWPDESYPRIPVLLEHAGPPERARRNERIYVLWRYDLKLTRFVEIARTSAVSTEWVVFLAPIACRELDIQRGPQLVKRAEDVAAEVSRTLDDGLRKLAPYERTVALARIFDDLAARTAEASEEVPAKPCQRETGQAASKAAG